MTETSKKIPPHWVDKLTTDLIANWPNIKQFNCNCGISVSGKQHVGRLRGEIILTNAVVNELKQHGYSATHSLILYTSDPWKGKESQRKAFSNPEEAKKYIDWRLIDVPDPTGQFSSWVDYFWKDFGDPLPKFSHEIDILRTHELYQEEHMRKVIIELITKKDQVREILNKYRGEHPFPENWIPFNPLCSKCRRIGTTKALEVDLQSYRVHYYCSACKEEGWSDMKLGKLTWRLEWLAIWYILMVHFEPYGKDHATVGGSRDSCIEVLETVLKHRGPFGFWNEWVGYSKGRTDFGDMTSSGFIGFTPTTWLNYADAEVLRYIYLKPPPRRRIILGLDKIPIYVDEYDKAERIYYGLEDFEDESELHTILRSFEIVHYNNIPKYRGFQLDYNHAVILSQLISNDLKGLELAIKKLRATEILKETPSEEIRAYIHRRLDCSRRWVNDYAPSHLQINIPEKISNEVRKQISEKNHELLLKLINALSSIKWTENEIKNSMIKVKEESNLTRNEMNQFFSILYKIFLGSPQGPRLAPFLSALDKEWVLSRLKILI